METIMKSRHAQSTTKSAHNTQRKSLAPLWKNAEANRFGIIPILLVIVGCMGGFAAAFGAKDDTIKLAFIAFPTILSLAFTLAVAPMRTILWASLIAVIADLAILII